jgi:hypothetical protein
MHLSGDELWRFEAQLSPTQKGSSDGENFFEMWRQLRLFGLKIVADGAAKRKFLWWRDDRI